MSNTAGGRRRAGGERFGGQVGQLLGAIEHRSGAYPAIPVARSSDGNNADGPHGRRRSVDGPAPVSQLRERLTRLGAPPRVRAPLERALPRGFEVVSTPFGDAVLRLDVISLPALEPDPGSVAYIDTETTGLDYSAQTYVGLLATTSEIRLLDEHPRTALLAAIARAIEARGNSLRLPMITRLCLARRLK